MDPMNEPRLPRCHACKGELVDATSTETWTVAGQCFEVTLPTQRCLACGEETFAASALVRAERAVARALIDSGMHSGDVVRWVRKSAGLRAVDLAELLGVAPETVSRWENDKHPIDRASWATLAALATEGLDGPTAARLRAAASPAQLPPVLRLDTAA